MAIQLEFLNFIVPIHIIKKKYPGGWEQCLKDYEYELGRSAWHDDELFRLGAMNPMDMGFIVEHWQSLGFRTHTSTGSKARWKEVCIVQAGFGPTLPCGWIEVAEDFAWFKETNSANLSYV